ncbi:MAG TPA: hypothetical protein VF510_01800 [Ktedonobacterales bacterium]
MFNTPGWRIFRLIGLGGLVILEGLSVLSAMLNIVFLPIGSIYPNVASVAVLILPAIVGAFSRRLEVAIVLAVTPFLVLALVYTTVYAPVWNIDLFQLGEMARRVAGAMFLFGGLGAFGWMVRNIFLRTYYSRLAKPA